MSKAIHGKKALPTEPTSLTDLFGLSAKTRFWGYFYLSTDNVGDATIAVTTGNSSADFNISSGGQSPTYSGVHLADILISGANTDFIILFGQKA